MQNFLNLLHDINFVQTIYALMLIVFGYLIARTVKKGLEKTTKKILSKQHQLLISRLAFYVILILFLISALHQLGFQLGVLLGAAGVFTVAVGFASQTAISNIISGLFLIFERPFVIGDKIKISHYVGEVFSIDFLSIKLKTRENTLVRIPSEKIIKTEVENLSHFSTRRRDLTLGISYQANVFEVKTIISDILEKIPECLQTPKPIIYIKEFGDSSVVLTLRIWTLQKNYTKIVDLILNEIKSVFDAKNIELPYPHLVVEQVNVE